MTFCLNFVLRPDKKIDIINKYIKIGGQTQYSFSEKQRGSNMISDNYMYRITPLGSLYEKDGSFTQKIGGDELMYNPLYNLVDGAVDRPLKTSPFIGNVTSRK